MAPAALTAEEDGNVKKRPAGNRANLLPTGKDPVAAAAARGLANGTESAKAKAKAPIGGRRFGHNVRVRVRLRRMPPSSAAQNPAAAYLPSPGFHGSESQRDRVEGETETSTAQSDQRTPQCLLPRQGQRGSGFWHGPYRITAAVSSICQLSLKTILTLLLLLCPLFCFLLIYAYTLLAEPMCTAVLNPPDHHHHQHPTATDPIRLLPTLDLRGIHCLMRELADRRSALNSRLVTEHPHLALLVGSFPKADDIGKVRKLVWDAWKLQNETEAVVAALRAETLGLRAVKRAAVEALASDRMGPWPWPWEFGLGGPGGLLPGSGLCRRPARRVLMALPDQLDELEMRLRKVGEGRPFYVAGAGKRLRELADMKRDICGTLLAGGEDDDGRVYKIMQGVTGQQERAVAESYVELFATVSNVCRALGGLDRLDEWCPRRPMCNKDAREQVQRLVDLVEVTRVEARMEMIRQDM